MRKDLQRGRVVAASTLCVLALLGQLGSATAAAVEAGVPPPRASETATRSMPAAAVEEESPGPRPEGPQQLLVGIIVGGREVDTIDVEYDGNTFLLPLDAFLALCECYLSETREQREIVTPIGAVELTRADVVEIAEREYLTESFLADRLAIPVLYDAARFALVLDIPWYGRGRGLDRGDGEPPKPDVSAPSATISNAYTQLRHSQQPGANLSSANVTMFGRVGGGLWRARYDDNFAGTRSLSEYGWMRRVGGDKLVMFGHQRVGLHPLLSSIELTGAQGAWTNQPLNLFQANLQPTELLPRQLHARTTITGVGVPAGTAVLRMNDVTVAYQTIGLDGIYEFQEVPLQPSQANRIEVLVYDRNNLVAPVDIHDHSRNASQFLLPAGAIVTQGGLGAHGNAVHPTLATRAAGFGQARYGVSSELTLEAVVQRQAGRTEIAFGGVFQPTPWGVASFAVGRANGASAYQFDATYQRDDWRGQVLSRVRQAGFFGVTYPAESEHFLEVSRRLQGRTFQVGLVGRYRRGLIPVKFLLPSASWRPSHRFFLRARPDFDGYYRVDGSWSPDRNWRLGVSRARKVTAVDLARSLSRALRVSALAEIRDEGGSRVAALASWYGGGSTALSVSGGPLLTDGRWGAIIQAQGQVLPGVLMGMQYETHSILDRPDAALDHRVSLSLTSNLSFSGGVLPGGLAGAPRVLGGIAGRVVVRSSYQVPASALEGLTVRVEGITTLRTNRGGFFRASNLPEGVYRVELEIDGLPIELTPRQRSLLVEVVPGAVTRVDFELDVEFGLAGRVRVNGSPVADAIVELLDATGAILESVRTDRFGLYRLDSLPLGSYTVRLSPDNAPGVDVAWPERRVVIVDDFLFDQDLTLEIDERQRPESVLRYP